MADFDPVAFGVRLRAEMERVGLDVKALRARIAEKSGKARGTSYASVWSYVNGQAALEPRREVIEAMADVFGVLPTYLTTGGPRTKEEERLASGAQKESLDNFAEALINEALPEFRELEFDSQGLIARACVRFEAAAPRGWFAPNDNTRAYAAYFVAFLAILRQSVFMPLWAWDNEPDLSEPAVRDYVRAALTAFVMSIPKRLPRPPVYRFETYHAQSVDTPHEKAHWVRWASAIHDDSQAPPETKPLARKGATTKKKRAPKR